jgi:hypothetical protein
MTTTPLLDFSTLAPERPKIRIDGELYELSLISDFGLTAQSQIARLVAEAAELQNAVADRPPPKSTGNAEADAAIAALGAIGDDEAERVMRLLEEIVQVILRAPADVRARLSQPQKQELILAFTAAVTAATPTPTKSRTMPPSRSTSASSSRSSRRPTASVPG